MADNLGIKSIWIFPVTYGRTDLRQVRSLSESAPLHDNKYLLYTYIAICLKTSVTKLVRNVWSLMCLCYLIWIHARLLPATCEEIIP